MNEHSPKGTIKPVHIVTCGCCQRFQIVRGTHVTERKEHALRMGWYATPQYGWTCPNHKTVAEVLKTAKELQAELDGIMGVSRGEIHEAREDTAGVHTCHADCPCQRGEQPVGDFEGE